MKRFVPLCLALLFLLCGCQSEVVGVGEEIRQGDAKLKVLGVARIPNQSAEEESYLVYFELENVGDKPLAYGPSSFWLMGGNGRVEAKDTLFEPLGRGNLQPKESLLGKLKFRTDQDGRLCSAYGPAQIELDLSGEVQKGLPYCSEEAEIPFQISQIQILVHGARSIVRENRNFVQVSLNLLNVTSAPVHVLEEYFCLFEPSGEKREVLSTLEGVQNPLFQSQLSYSEKEGREGFLEFEVSGAFSEIVLGFTRDLNGEDYTGLRLRLSEA